MSLKKLAAIGLGGMFVFLLVVIVVLYFTGFFGKLWNTIALYFDGKAYFGCMENLGQTMGSGGSNVLAHVNTTALTQCLALGKKTTKELKGSLLPQDMKDVGSAELGTMNAVLDSATTLVVIDRQLKTKDNFGFSNAPLNVSEKNQKESLKILVSYAPKIKQLREYLLQNLSLVNRYQRTKADTCNTLHCDLITNETDAILLFSDVMLLSLNVAPLAHPVTNLEDHEDVCDYSWISPQIRLLEQNQTLLKLEEAQDPFADKQDYDMLFHIYNATIDGFKALQLVDEVGCAIKMRDKQALISAPGKLAEAGVLLAHAEKSVEAIKCKNPNLDEKMCQPLKEYVKDEVVQAIKSKLAEIQASLSS